MQIAKAAADSGPFERNGGWSPPDPDGASPAAYSSTAPSSTRTERARSATQVQAARISSGSETWAIEDPQIQIRQAEVEAALPRCPPSARFQHGVRRTVDVLLRARDLSRQLGEADPGRRLDPVGMKQMGDQLDPVDQARTGTGEGRGAVNGEDAAGTQGLQPLGVCQRLRARLLQVPAAGHRDDDVWIEAAPPTPLDLRRLLS